MLSAQHREGSCKCQLLSAGIQGSSPAQLVLLGGGVTGKERPRELAQPSNTRNWALASWGFQNPADVLKSFVPVMFLGSRILSIFLMQPFGLATCGSSGSKQGSREDMGLMDTEVAWAEACLAPGSLYKATLALG